MRCDSMKIFVVCSLVVVFFLLSATQQILAAPVPPLRVVNHETKECSEIFGGDECMDCFPPEGWEILGFAYDEPCPEGYTEVAEPGYNCESFKNQFCCMEGHSGAHGDCRDMVINKRQKSCTFVDDVTTAELPRGWQAKPGNVANYDWFCPEKYEWVSDVNADTNGQGGFSCCSSAMLLGPAVLLVVLGRKRLVQ
jgi:hypothetical protein